jgi:hypothetical protein
LVEWHKMDEEIPRGAVGSVLEVGEKMNNSPSSSRSHHTLPHSFSATRARQLFFPFRVNKLKAVTTDGCVQVRFPSGIYNLPADSVLPSNQPPGSFRCEEQRWDDGARVPQQPAAAAAAGASPRRWRAPPALEARKPRGVQQGVQGERTPTFPSFSFSCCGM